MMDAARNEQIALHRYSVIAEAVSSRLSPTERGLVVRALSARPFVDPDGRERTYSRSTVDRWIALYKRDGLSGLAPVARVDKGRGRVNPELMAEAVRLRRAVPTRSAAQIGEIIHRAHGVVIAERTLREHLARSGVSRRHLLAEPARAFGRFEASRRNEIWIGDVLVGPFVPHPRRAGSKRAKLFVLVDDHSRLLVGGRWMEEENTRAGQDVLRAALSRRGVPEHLYVDNGAPYSSVQLARTCAVLGIHLIHSKPYQPAGRGKQERLNRYIRERFLTEAEARGIKSFAELNDAFSAWTEQVANTRVHAETKQRPIERFLSDGPPALPDPARLREAFRWALPRKVTKTFSGDLDLCAAVASGPRFGVERHILWLPCATCKVSADRGSHAGASRCADRHVRLLHRRRRRVVPGPDRGRLPAASAGGSRPRRGNDSLLCRRSRALPLLVLLDGP